MANDYSYNAFNYLRIADLGFLGSLLSSPLWKFMGVAKVTKGLSEKSLKVNTPSFHGKQIGE